MEIVRKKEKEKKKKKKTQRGGWFEQQGKQVPTTRSHEGQEVPCRFRPHPLHGTDQRTTYQHRAHTKGRAQLTPLRHSLSLSPTLTLSFSLSDPFSPSLSLKTLYQTPLSHSHGGAATQQAETSGGGDERKRAGGHAREKAEQRETRESERKKTVRGAHDITGWKRHGLGWILALGALSSRGCTSPEGRHRGNFRSGGGTHAGVGRGGL